MVEKNNEVVAHKLRVRAAQDPHPVDYENGLLDPLRKPLLNITVRLQACASVGKLRASSAQGWGKPLNPDERILDNPQLLSCSESLGWSSGFGLFVGVHFASHG